VEELEDLPRTLGPLLKAGDVVLTLGAGSIGAVAPTLPAALRVPSLVGAKA
jgi:UDP-N-acetylmuramate--alanine ligase